MHDFLQSLRQFDLERLGDWDSIGSWPLAVKSCLWGLAFALALAAGYLLHLAPLGQQLDGALARELQLRAAVEQKHMQASPLPAYRQQRQELQAAFQAALRQLPAQAQMSSLIEDITQAGAAHGLLIDSIDLQAGATKGFYAEQPMQILVRGGYHSLGAFAGDLARLPRLLTLDDFVLRASGKGEAGAALTLEVHARSYSYQEAGGG